MEQSNQNDFTPQKSEQWKRLRLGKLTSGHAYMFMGAKGPLNDASKKFLYGKIMELCAGEARSIKATSLDHGNEWEPFVKQQIANKYNSEYFEADYIQNPDLCYHGGSPDGLIEISGITTTPEIKCPVWEEALINRHRLIDVEACKAKWPEIYWQCQSNMYLQGTKQALAASFHVKLPLSHTLTDLIIPYNNDDILLMFKNIKIAYAWMKEEAETLGINIEELYKEYSKPIESLNPITLAA